MAPSLGSVALMNRQGRYWSRLSIRLDGCRAIKTGSAVYIPITALSETLAPVIFVAVATHSILSPVDKVPIVLKSMRMTLLYWMLPYSYLMLYCSIQKSTQVYLRLDQMWWQNRENIFTWLAGLVRWSRYEALFSITTEAICGEPSMYPSLATTLTVHVSPPVVVIWRCTRIGSTTARRPFKGK